MNEEKIKFRRTFTIRGDSQGVNIPPELIEYLQLQPSDVILMQAETGKHGKYITLWKEQHE